MVLTQLCGPNSDVSNDVLVTYLDQGCESDYSNWLHEGSLVVGMKASHDLLSFSFEMEQGEVVGLVAQVDPEDNEGSTSWWLVVGNGIAEEYKL